jgi:hypothetical protein
MSEHPHCPACRGCIRQLDLLDGEQRAIAEPGDLIICERCACIGIHDADLSLRLPSEAELRVLLREPATMAALTVIYRQRAATGMMPG